MTCPLDLEQITLFLNDDLGPTEREIVVLHLNACTQCRTRATEFGADSSAIARSVSAVVLPQGIRRGPSRPKRAWQPAAVAVVVLMILAGATQVEAVQKGLFILFPFLQVQEFSREELHALDNKPATGASVMPVDFATVQGAEKAVGYRIARLSHLPVGYAPKRVFVSLPDQPVNSLVGQVYVSAMGDVNLVLQQTRSGETIAMAEQGTTRELTVKGEKAAMVERRWSDADGVGINRSLFFQWQGQAMVLTSAATKAGGTVLTAEDLINLAESLQ